MLPYGLTLGKRFLASRSSRSTVLRMYCLEASLKGWKSHAVTLPVASAEIDDVASPLAVPHGRVEGRKVPAPACLNSKGRHDALMGRILGQVANLVRIGRRYRRAGPDRRASGRTSKVPAESSRSARRRPRRGILRSPRRDPPVPRNAGRGCARRRPPGDVLRVATGQLDERGEDIDERDALRDTRPARIATGPCTISGTRAEPSNQLILYQAPRSPSISP